MKRVMITLAGAVAVLGCAFAVTPASGTPSSTGDVEIQVENVFRVWARPWYSGTSVTKPSASCAAITSPISVGSAILIDYSYIVSFYNSSVCDPSSLQAVLSAATPANPSFNATHYDTTPAN